MNKLTITKIGAIVFIALLVLLHIINTAVNPIWQPISEYALGNAGWLMNITFFSLGAEQMHPTIPKNAFQSLQRVNKPPLLVKVLDRGAGADRGPLFTGG